MIHTPYDGSSKPFTISLKPLDPKDWIDVDGNFDLYIAEKRRLYVEERDNVLAAEPGTEEAQAEVYRMLSEQAGIPEVPISPLPVDPMVRWIAAAGLLVQEDLVLMRRSPDGWRLVAASLCFPSAWSLREKFGRPLHEVHGPVPGFNQGTRNASLIERMFDKLNPDQPVLRWNWSLYGEARLYLPSSVTGAKRRFGDGTDISGRVTIRLERQTLRKLPKSGDILFTIRTYLDPLEVLEQSDDGPRLAEAMLTQLNALTGEEINYKGLANEKDRLSLRLGQIAGKMEQVAL